MDMPRVRLEVLIFLSERIRCTGLEPRPQIGTLFNLISSSHQQLGTE
jgi:hypothetical protein